MPDIRLIRPRTRRVWLWSGAFAVIGLAVWGSTYLVGDPTDRKNQRGVGASAGFGEVRAPLIPAESAPFGSLTSLQTRDLGRLVHVTGEALSPVRSNSLWIRADDGRRILLRFEPAPDSARVPGIHPGSRISLDGYLGKISRAELLMWMDTLGVQLPRPTPGNKFGDLPDPGFERVDSLFIKNFYISVRPEALANR